VGDTLYDSPDAYRMPWGAALKHFNLSCKVVSAVPDSPEGGGGGSVVFRLLRPNKDRTALESDNKEHELSQGDFVEFLKTGKMPPDP
jgi:hypothetical protein